MFTAHVSAADSILATVDHGKGPIPVRLSDAPFSRAVYLDVEGADADCRLVLRGEDKHKVGSAKDPADAAQVWNDEAGAPRPVVLASSDNRMLMETAAAQLCDFYAPEGEGAPETFAERVEALGTNAREVLPILLATFGGRTYNRNGWRVGSWHGYVAERAQGSAKRAGKVARQAVNSGAAAEAAKRVTSADAMADLIDPSTGQIDPMKLQAKLTAAFAALAAQS